MRNSITLSESCPSIADSMKLLAKGVINASQLMDLRFGIVESVEPLKIRINPKMVLDDNYLILTNAVKDHAVDISVSWSTVEDDYLHEGAMKHTHQPGQYKDGEGSPLSGVSGAPVAFDTKHKHDIKGRKKIIIHNGLTLGEKVLLLRTQGGQDYVVIDRVDEIPLTGEWVE